MSAKNTKINQEMKLMNDEVLSCMYSQYTIWL